MASAPIEQDAAYWEVKCVSAGSVGIGVARKLGPKELERGSEGGSGDEDPRRRWVMFSKLQVGDTIGVAFSQSDLPNLAFTKNGKPSPSYDVRKVPGMVYPLISVSGGASVKVVFETEDFASQPPPRFSALMVAQSVL
jgi:hypothetical protein